MQVKEKVSETRDVIRQKENFYLKNEEDVLYYLSVYSLKKFVPEIVPLWLKNWNQCAYSRGGEG